MEKRGDPMAMVLSVRTMAVPPARRRARANIAHAATPSCDSFVLRLHVCWGDLDYRNQTPMYVRDAPAAGRVAVPSLSTDACIREYGVAYIPGWLW